MSKALKARLKYAVQESEKKNIVKLICEELSIDSCVVKFKECEFNSILSFFNGKNVEMVSLSVSDISLYFRFANFLQDVNVVNGVLFYVQTKNSCCFLNLPMSILKSKPDFFWKIKDLDHDISDCVLVEERGQFGFAMLYTEYGYELYKYY